MREVPCPCRQKVPDVNVGSLISTYCILPSHAASNFDLCSVSDSSAHHGKSSTNSIQSKLAHLSQKSPPAYRLNIVEVSRDLIISTAF